MGIRKVRFAVLLLVFLILAPIICSPVRAADNSLQNVAVTKLVDKSNYKKTLFVITTNDTTYHIIVQANITVVGSETLIDLNATLYNPENETVLASATIPDTLTDHPTIGGAPAVVQAIHIHFPEWVVEDLVYLILPAATIIAIIAEVFYIVYEIATAPLSYLFNEIINEVPLVWASVPWVFREIMLADSNNDDTGKQGIEPSDYYHLGSFDLYVPISGWDLWNAIVHDDYYIRTAKNWWEIEQKEYYVWIIPLFTYFIAQKVSSVQTPPVASFTYSPSKPGVNEQVVFISTSYATTLGGYIASQTWSLGDNTTETSANFTHVYQHSGNYTVVINVKDNNGLTDSTNETVSVQPGPQVQMRVVPNELSLQVQQGQDITAQFLVEETLNQSDLLGVNFEPSDLLETFGNQTISSGNVTFNVNDITVTKGTYTNITTTFNAPLSSPIDWYSGNITVTSANGGNETIFVNVFVYDPPTANFTWSPLIPKVGDVVTFDASSSVSGGGPITSYAWNFGDGNQTVTTIPIITHAFSSAATYLVTLNVTDSNGLWNTTQGQVLVVQPYGPKANFTVSPETANIGQLVTFDASSSQSGYNGTNQMPITLYAWNFGDGQTANTTTPTVTHAFSSAGIYYPSLTVVASGATPETGTITKRVLIVASTVGGYSVSLASIKTKDIASLWSLYLGIVAMLATVFTAVKRKRRED